MIAFYGFGGGFGHLSRIKAFVNTYAIKEPYLILTNNHCAYRLFDQHQIFFLPENYAFERASLRNFIKLSLEKYSPKAFYIDTFPCGILGELSDDLFEGIKVHYLARRLKWNKYELLINHELTIDCAYVFEPLENEHEFFVYQASQIQSATLRFPSPSGIPEKLGKLSGPIWLVVHTAHPDEIEVLIDHATDLAKMEGKKHQIVVLTDQVITAAQDIILFHHENPVDWFPHAERIFTAAGFNTWHQLGPWRSRHIAIPFPRRFDDQFWRVKQR